MPISTSGYHTCTINGKCCYTHRYVWEQAHGPIPDGKYIDHINNDKLDNRLENLRLCDNSENNCNTGLRANNTTGYKGITQRRGKFRVQVKKHGVTIDRLFSDLDAAVAFAKEARNALHGAFANHG